MTKYSILTALVLASSVAQAARYKVGDGSSVRFIAHITGGSFTAKTADVRGSVQYDEAGKVTSGSIVVNANTLETGMSTRDQHMREKYLETERYPIIALDLTGATLPPTGTGTTDVDGTLEIHGVKRPARFHVVIADAGNGVRRVTSQFQVDVTEFGIAQPKFAVVKMDTKVDVSVDTRFVAAGEP